MKTTPAKHILIVDDSADQRMLLKTILESKGYTTDCIANGQDALILLHTCRKLPNLILLDLRMPVMGGLEFRKIQRNDDLLKEIPVIIMSGESHADGIQAVTGTEVMLKPLSMASMMEVIERNLWLH